MRTVPFAILSGTRNPHPEERHQDEVVVVTRKRYAAMIGEAL